MKTLLSVSITESQKGEFPHSGPISWVISVGSTFHSDFTILQRPGAITKAEVLLVLLSVLAVSCDYQ